MAIIEDGSFDPILDDYLFFEQHSTESEADLKAYLPHVASIDLPGQPAHLLDFGSGTGSFSSRFLDRVGWRPDKLTLTITEPGSIARKRSRERLQAYTEYVVQDYPTLFQVPKMAKFDLILANHVLYYVDGLVSVLGALSSRLRPGGKLLAAMAGAENTIIQCWNYGYGMVGVEVPYFTGDNMAGALDQLNLQWRRERVFFLVDFPDSRENRLKMLRFIFGVNLSGLQTEPLLAFFDPYQQNGNIRIETSHYIYNIG
ncbi:MAG: class I SAM-dependent methyltransferase [Bacteroidetes bacterium]|nr:MAG: class I SAM-dependent methyltransferase [Bacteroidota bacterium]